MGPDLALNSSLLRRGAGWHRTLDELVLRQTGHSKSQKQHIREVMNPLPQTREPGIADIEA